MAPKDLTGLTFHRWTILCRDDAPHRKVRWLCRCECGSERVLDGDTVSRGRTKSCGCYKRDRLASRTGPRRDLTGQPFGLLTALRHHDKQGRQLRWMCRCKCGKDAIVSTANLTTGHTKSCGCMVHSNTASVTHGLTRKAPEYGVWAAMKRRCNNPNVKDYPDYGGRGIRVCERWHSFENFYADMGTRPSKKHSLDRYPNQNGNYEPGNVRWATPKEQGRNQRTNRLVTYQGRTQSLAGWCEDLSLPYTRTICRLRAGWPTEMAFTAPSRCAKRGK